MKLLGCWSKLDVKYFDIPIARQLEKSLCIQVTLENGFVLAGGAHIESIAFCLENAKPPLQMPAPVS